MRLSDLLGGTSTTLPETGGIGDIRIAGLAADSRRIEPGFLFAALPGAARDGRAFIAEAVRRGAAAILAPRDTVAPAGLAGLGVVEEVLVEAVFALSLPPPPPQPPPTPMAVTRRNTLAARTPVISPPPRTFNSLTELPGRGTLEPIGV